MSKYVAFLRGINVGGKNLIKMDALRAEFEKAGFESVKTFIQSGNVIFQAGLVERIEAEKKIEKMLSAKFRYDAKALVRSKKEMENTIKHFPKIFENAEWKHNVIFLSSAIDSKGVLKKFEIRKGVDKVSYYKGALFWSAKLDQITKSNMLKLSAREEYKEMTVRNINTTKKVLELMSN